MCIFSDYWTASPSPCQNTVQLFHYVTGYYINPLYKGGFSHRYSLSVHICFLSPSLAAMTFSDCLTRLQKVAWGTLSEQFRCCMSLPRFVIRFEETTFFIGKKLLLFSRDFTVYAAPASDSQLEADGLPWGKVKKQGEQELREKITVILFFSFCYYVWKGPKSNTVSRLLPRLFDPSQQFPQYFG